LKIVPDGEPKGLCLKTPPSAFAVILATAMKLSLKFVLGVALGIIALFDIAINVFPLTNDFGANIVPSLHSPFIPTKTQGVCGALFKSAAGFPFDTEHYGACGGEHSNVAAAIDWSIVGLLALVSATLISKRSLKIWSK
jgi:hypothetical protein